MRKIKELKNSLLLTTVYLLLVSVFWLFDVPCLFERFLGVSCPGCGMSRAVLSALRWDLAAAFSYHPMFWSMPVLYVYFLCNGRLFPNKYLDYGILIAIALGFFINWLAKLV